MSEQPVPLYRRVSLKIWNDEKFRKLSPDGKLLYLYLLTAPESTPIPGVLVGITPLRLVGAFVTEETAPQEMIINWWARVKALITEFEKVELIVRCPDTGLIWLPKAVLHNPPTSPGMIRKWARYWRELPNSTLLAPIYNTLKASILRKHAALQAEFVHILIPPGCEGINLASSKSKSRPKQKDASTKAPQPAEPSQEQFTGNDPEIWGATPHATQDATPHAMVDATQDAIPHAMGGAMGDQKEKENKKKKEKKKISDEDSSERSAQSEPLVVALDPSAKDVFPVIGPPGLWRCPTNLLEELFDPANYPGIDAKTEFLKARMYVIGNERKRKTRGGMKRYLVGWFGRAQDNAGARNGSNGSFAARPLTQAQRVAEIAQRLRTLELEGKDPKLSDL